MRNLILALAIVFVLGACSDENKPKAVNIEGTWREIGTTEDGEYFERDVSRLVRYEDGKIFELRSQDLSDGNGASDEWTEVGEYKLTGDQFSEIFSGSLGQEIYESRVVLENNLLEIHMPTTDSKDVIYHLERVTEEGY